MAELYYNAATAPAKLNAGQHAYGTQGNAILASQDSIKAELTVAVNESLENLAVSFQRLLQLFSHAVNGATSPTSSREACDNIQTQWRMVQAEISHIQELVGKFENEALLYVEELDRIVAELSYGQGDPKEHRSQFPFFALKVLSCVKVAVKEFQELLPQRIAAREAARLGGSEKVSDYGGIQSLASTERLNQQREADAPFTLARSGSKTNLNDKANLSLSTSALQSNINAQDSRTLRNAAPEKLHGEGNSLVAPSVRGVVPDSHAMSPVDELREVRQLEILRIMEEQRGSVKEKIVRLESAKSPVVGNFGLARSQTNASKLGPVSPLSKSLTHLTNEGHGGSGSSNAADHGVSDRDFVNSSANTEQTSFKGASSVGKYSDATGAPKMPQQWPNEDERELYNGSSTPAAGPERPTHMQQKIEAVYAQDIVGYTPEGVNLASRPSVSALPDQPRANVLVEQEKHLYEIHKQQQQYLMQQQQIAKSQMSSSPSQEHVPYNLSMERGANKVNSKRLPESGAESNFDSAYKITEQQDDGLQQHQAPPTQWVNQNQVHIPATQSLNYILSQPNTYAAYTQQIPHKSHVNQETYASTNFHQYPQTENLKSTVERQHNHSVPDYIMGHSAANQNSESDASSAKLENLQLEKWIQSVPPQQVQYDYSANPASGEGDSAIQGSAGSIALPQQSTGLLESFQVILIPLNGMFDTGYLNLTIPNRLGRHNGTNYPRFLAFPSQVVSRNHMEIWSDKARVYIRDIGSMSGTFLNGERLSEPGKQSAAVEVKSGDRIRLGKDFVEEKNLDDPNFVPEVRYRSVKMKVLVIPKTPNGCQTIAVDQHYGGGQKNYADGNFNGSSANLIKSGSGSASASNLNVSNVSSSLSAAKAKQLQAPAKAASQKITYIATICEYQGKVKEIQLTPARPNTSEMCNTYSATIKHWESKKRLTVEEFIPSIGRVQEVDISRDPINQQLYNVTLEDGTFAGSIQVFNDIKVLLNLPISGSMASSLTITGDFKDCKYFVILKSNQSREQKCIGESIAKSLYKTASSSNSNVGTLRIGVGSHHVVRWMYQLEFEDGEWSRLLLLANVFMAVAFHK